VSPGIAFTVTKKTPLPRGAAAGEWQRLSLARTFFRDDDIVILDVAELDLAEPSLRRDVVHGSQSDRIHVPRSSLVANPQIDPHNILSLKPGKNLAPQFSSHLKRIEGPERAYFQCLDSVHHVIYWACGRRQVEDIIHVVEIEALSDVVTSEFEAWFIEEMRQVFFPARNQVVDAKNVITFGYQCFRSKKSRTTSHNTLM
jgi:hypothetical protein